MSPIVETTTHKQKKSLACRQKYLEPEKHTCKQKRKILLKSCFCRTVPFRADGHCPSQRYVVAKITESSRNHSLMKACSLQAYFQSAWLSSQGADWLSSAPACHVSQGTQGDTETNAARDMKSAQKQVAEGNCLLFIPPVHFFLYLPPCSFCAFRTCCSLCLLVAGWLFPHT